MKKYIIKNCPAIYNSDIIDNDCNDLTNYDACSCENNSDCLLKRIVYKCYKATHDDLVITDDYNKTAREVSEIYGRAGLAQEILQLLGIEEVNEN